MKILSRLSKFFLTGILFFSCIFLFSCKSQKALGYAEDMSSDTTGKLQVKYTEPLIQKNDLLSIVVVSGATDGGKTDLMYNLPPVTTTGTSSIPQGYPVDNDGYIQHQRLGKMKAEGLTKPQLAEEVRKRLDTVLTTPSVSVRLLNFRVTMLGEVSHAGQISIPSERVTILEAVGLAGDVTVYGKKDDVVVLRDVDGVIEHGKIDLSSKTLFDSPYYFLRQNDIVLVNPNKNKARLSDQVFNQRLGIAFSMINMIALLYNIFHQ